MVSRSGENREDSSALQGRRIDYRIFDVYADLTDTEKRLADTVLECHGTFASYSAAELARRAGVSKATAVRFFRRLGYESYDAARNEAREEPHWGSPLYVDRSSDFTQGSGREEEVTPLAAHFMRDVDNLKITQQFLQEADLEKAVSLICDAKRIWVVGFRNSFALAHYARGVLKNIRTDVRYFPSQALDIAEDMAGIETCDAVLVVGFRRWPRILNVILNVLHKRKIPAVLITDKTASGTEMPADIILRCQNRGAGMFDSYAAGISLINYIVTQVGERLGEKSTHHLEEVEAMHEDLQDIQ